MSTKKKRGFHSVDYEDRLDFLADHPEMWGRMCEARLKEVTELLAKKEELIRKIKEYKEPPPLRLEKTLGRLKLPQEILCKIMECLCDESRRYKLLLLLLEELHTIALSCPDFLATIPHCYKYLESKLSPVPGSDKYDWQEFIVQIREKKLPQLKEALKVLSVPRDCNKISTSLLFPARSHLVDMIIRLLSKTFGLMEPRRVPIKLAYHVSQEQKTDYLQYTWVNLENARLVQWDSLPLHPTSVQVCRELFRLYKTDEGVEKKVEEANEILRLKKERERRREIEQFEFQKKEKERIREANLKLRCKGSGCYSRGAEACKYRMCISHCPGCPRPGHDQKLTLGRKALSIDFILN